MKALRSNTGRERLIVKNMTKRILVIGDLPKIPSFQKGQTRDLLERYTKAELAKSQDLRRLIDTKKLRLTKVVDDHSFHTYSSLEVLA